MGVVDRTRIVDGSTCRTGDALIGLASSGLHSNGFSLARRVFSGKELKSDLGRTLLRPTRIYVRAVRELQRSVRIKAMAHITGGGFPDNIPRVIPEHLGAVIRRGTWTVPRIFTQVKTRGKVADAEMFRTFNMGIGLVLVVGKRSAERALKILQDSGQRAWIIGGLEAGVPGVRID